MPNILVREARLSDASAVARVHVQNWRTTYPESTPANLQARLAYSERDGRWTQILGASTPEQFVLVVEDSGGRIIGFAAAGHSPAEQEHGDAWLYSVHVLAGHRGKGIGRELVQRAAQRLMAAPCERLVARVLTDSLSHGFFEALGARREAAQRIQIDAVSFDEVRYVWDVSSSLFYRQ